MALFTEYAPPGVYTDVVYQDSGVSLLGQPRIAVIIAEGMETKSLNPIELHRGSSATSPELRVAEDLSHAVDGQSRSFQLSYFPVVNAKGAVSSDPSDVSLYTVDNSGNKTPLRVTSLSGATGAGMLQDILTNGTTLKADYKFKRTDTLIESDDLTFQVPAKAYYKAQVGLVLSTSLPGHVGNQVSLEFTMAGSGSGKSDLVAVSGVGSDTISIELRNSANNAVRTLANIAALIAVGIPTQSAGILLVDSCATPTAVATAVAARSFSGGAGQGSNKVFKLSHGPVVDGTNGGVVTNDTSKVTILVNGLKAAVSALDGLDSLVTLASGLNESDSIRASYYVNTFQDTYDEIPVANVSKILSTGFGPGRMDFVAGEDFILDENKIYWGASFTAKQGSYTPGYLPFNGESVIPQLVDEKVYLVQCSGSVDGINDAFSAPESVVSGSGLSVVTNDPKLISVYVGSNPVSAMDAGAVRVTRLDGKSGNFSLFLSPSAQSSNQPNKVYATYSRSVLDTKAFNVSVATPGITGQGTYTVKDEQGHVVPVITEGASTVVAANFATTGIVWPKNGISDLRAVAGAATDEIVTATFLDDGSHNITTPGVQATLSTVQVGLRFRMSTPGAVFNTNYKVAFVSTTPCSDLASVTSASNIGVTTVTVNVAREDPSNPGQPHPTAPTRTLQDIIDLFGYVLPEASVTFTATGGVVGRILCEADGSVTNLNTVCSSHAAVVFSGGVDAVTSAYSHCFKVTSSRTLANSKADGFGITGGVNGTIGYVGQTYIDGNTGLQFTIVDPAKAADYGWSILPTQYHFAPGDKLVFNIGTGAASFVTSSKPMNAIPGLRTQVTTTFGMNTGDNLVLTTFNKVGNEPAIGDYYWLGLEQGLSDYDYNIQFYSNPEAVIAAKGPVLPENKASLMAQAFFQNGGQFLGIVQVKKQDGMDVASDQSYMEAIAKLASNLPGSDKKANYIGIGSTSATVIQYLNRFLVTQASPRKKAEATGFFGLDKFATPASARTLARGLASERMIGAFPGSVIVSLDVNGVATDYAVDGSFCAAQLLGLRMNPANDVATTLTGQKAVGASRMSESYDDTVLNQVAADGLTVLVDADGAFEVRHYKTTSIDNVLKSEPTSVDIVDYTRQSLRVSLKQFVGRKGVDGIITDITVAVNSLLGSLVDAKILSSFKSLKVTIDPNDPTTVNVSVNIRPLFSVLWINVTLGVSIKG